MATATMPQAGAQVFVPREHGATAMMLTPFFCAAILLREFYWQELVALVAIVVALVIKDPLVVIARQRWVWRQPHPETAVAKRSAAFQFLILSISGLALLLTRDWRAFIPLFVGAAAFTALAVTVTVRNRQRSVWFQVASAVALSATSVVACLAGPGRVPDWCWLLWALSAMQATAGVFVVHSRLDQRIAVRKSVPTRNRNRQAAFVLQVILLAAAVSFAVLGRPWIAAALAIAGVAYLLELARQSNPASLQLPLKSVGQQALALSILFAIVLIVGLW